MLTQAFYAREHAVIGYSAGVIDRLRCVSISETLFGNAKGRGSRQPGEGGETRNSGEG